MSRDNPLRIPRNILAAAHRAGLNYPLWYVGRRENLDRPREKTLADLARDAAAFDGDARPETAAKNQRLRDG